MARRLDPSSSNSPSVRSSLSGHGSDLTPVNATVNLPTSSTNHNMASTPRTAFDIPPEYVKEGSDWYALFTPNVKRTLDVQLLRTLPHTGSVIPFRDTYCFLNCTQSRMQYPLLPGRKDGRNW